MKKRGFTLVELLGVIVIIGLLMTIAIPVVSSLRERSERMESISKQRQLALGILQHAADDDGRLMASVPDGQHWCRVALHEFLVGRRAEQWSDMNDAFICPAVRETDDAGQPVSKQERTYGFNAHLAAAVGFDDQRSETPLARITFPAQAVLLADFPRPNFNRGQLTQPAKVQALRERFKGEIVHLAFVDGHMDSMTVDELLEISEEGSTTPEGRKFFWGR